MATTSITFTNLSDSVLLIQTEPWADVYKLAKGETIEFSADSTRVSVEENGDERYLTFLDSSNPPVAKRV
jgi:hypothetical protein